MKTFKIKAISSKSSEKLLEEYSWYKPVQWFGKKIRIILENLSIYSHFIYRIFTRTPLVFKNLHLTMHQMMVIGISSLPLIAITSIFTGGVTAWQAAYQFSDYIPLTYLGTAVGKAVMLELSPVLTALVVAGRIGAAMAAELGTMRVTEQIDAMESLALDPFRFLLAPRLVASTIMLPSLTAIGATIAIWGAIGVANFFLGLSIHTFVAGLRLFFETKDVIVCLVKAFVFGLIIAMMGCYYGYNTTGGAEGVGVSTKKSVVAASVWILISDYLVVALFL